MEQAIKTVNVPWTKLKATNFTDASFASRVSTLTEPAEGSGVVKIKNVGGRPVDNAMMLRFFGAGSDNQTFAVRVLGWAQEVSTGSWEYAIIGDFTCTLSASTGTASCAITNSDREVDTIADVTACVTEIVSPGGDIRGAHATIDIRGFSYVEFLFDMTGATSGNLLWRTL